MTHSHAPFGVHVVKCVFGCVAVVLHCVAVVLQCASRVTCDMTYSHAPFGVHVVRYEIRCQPSALLIYIWMSHITHMNESCHTHECVMSHIAVQVVLWHENTFSSGKRTHISQLRSSPPPFPPPPHPRFSIALSLSLPPTPSLSLYQHLMRTKEHIYTTKIWRKPPVYTVIFGTLEYSEHIYITKIWRKHAMRTCNTRTAETIRITVYTLRKPHQTSNKQENTFERQRNTYISPRSPPLFIFI